MEERYFYVSPDKIYKNEVIVENEEYYHLYKVLRKKKGDLIHVVDGKGNDYLVKIEEFKNCKAIGKILEKHFMPNETNSFFALGIGIIKGERMDMIFEKGTELGVSAFYPILSERVVVNPKNLKIERWRKIVLSAMKQSRRSILPYVYDPLPLNQFLKETKNFDTKILLDEEGENSFEIKENSEKILIVAGPEGSFTKDEKKLFEQEGFFKVKMGKRIMRTETAIIAGLSIFVFLKKEI
ncbi:MAG: RsmE family RNA methyltransferase [candidate division WOR-3 bacterium]